MDTRNSDCFQSCSGQHFSPKGHLGLVTSGCNWSVRAHGSWNIPDVSDQFGARHKKGALSFIAKKAKGTK